MHTFSSQTRLSLYNTEAEGQGIDLLFDDGPWIVISEKEYLELKCEAGFRRSLHHKALLRQEALKKKIKEQKGQIRDLRNRVFGKKSEKKSSGKKDGKPKPSKSKRHRGQQPGSKGHGRTERPDLPQKEEVVDFPETPACSKCGELYTLDESKESEIIEVDVKAYKRKIIRHRMKKGCSCKGTPDTITAPAPAKVLPKSPYGNSVWGSVLLQKYNYSHPTNRLLNYYGEMGLPISPGTIAGGLKRLTRLFEPVYDALRSRQMTENRFHNDESGWKVFESVEDKVGNRWWLWVSRSPSVVFFQIAPGRGADVPVKHFENIQHDDKIILVCDRYTAYKSLAKQLLFIILAFCWAHVRRDFLDAARKYPDMEDWTLCWVEKIGELYHTNKLRRESFNAKLPVQKQCASFKKHHEKLIEKMDAMAQDRDAFIEAHDPDKSDLLSNCKYKILESLKNHWKGLSVFVDHPEVPMDNNYGEQSIRNPVTGRKNFYGSGSLWSAQLAAMMYSIFQSLGLWGINRDHWLKSFLNACAENYGKVPEDLSDFLPWEMDKDRRGKLARPYDT